jgi:cyclohexanecarboxylate-CoA ligase
MSRTAGPLRATHPAAAADRWRRLGWWPDEPLGETMARACRQWGSRLAIVDGRRRITFAELDEITRRLSTALIGLGVSGGDVVSFQLPSWWEGVALTIACWRVGAVANPMLPSLRARELAAITQQARPSVLIVPERFRGFDHTALADSISHRSHLLVARATEATRPDSVTGLLSRNRPADAATLAGCRPDPDAPALLLYTSGTTAGPKGVLHTHNTLRAEADGVRAAHECSAADVLLLTMPLAHIGGVLYGILLSLVVGLRVVLLDVWDPAEAVRLLEREQVTMYPAVPVFIRSMVGAGSFRPSAMTSMRLCTIGGSPVTASDVLSTEAALGCWCKRSYGSTEMPTLTSGPHRDPMGRVATTDGILIGPSQIRIVDDTGVDVAVGRAGEIWCRGPELFVGYVDDALNTGAFTPDGWYRSGDIGVVDEDGFLTVVGRKRDLIIRGGENISPEEVESILADQPEVAEAAVVGMPDRMMGERACAFVALRDPSFDHPAMVARLRDRGLATFKIPERLEVRSSLPRTATGKVRKEALRAEIAAIIAGDDPAPGVRPSAR